MQMWRVSKNVLVIWGAAALVGLGLSAGGLLLSGVAGAIMIGAGVVVLGLVLYGALLLRRVDTSEWLITWDIPEPLQFCAYVGQQEGFSVADADPAATVAERAWRGWWQTLPQRLFAHHAHLDDLLRRHADMPPLEVWRAVGSPGSPASLDYDPPTFESLTPPPELRALCQQHWPAFARRWQVEKPDIIDQMRRQGRAVREERIVRDCVRAAGKTSSAPFSLRLDFVRWPATYQQRCSDQHIVLSVAYLEPGQAAQLRAVIAAAVSKLI